MQLIVVMEHKETGCQQPEGPILCINNCGFFGSAATMNMCSKCHKEMIMKQEHSQLAASSIDSIVNGGDGGKGPIIAATVEVAVAQVEEKTIVVQPPFVAETSEAAAIIPKAKEGPNRCATCRKRVGLTGFNCRCGNMYCALHRYSDKHDCQFDYQTAARDAIAKANPVVKAEKLEKIWRGQWGTKWVAICKIQSCIFAALSLNIPFLFAATSLSRSTLWCSRILAAARSHPQSSPKWFACWLCCVSLFSYSWWFQSVLWHFHLGSSVMYYCLMRVTFQSVIVISNGLQYFLLSLFFCSVGFCDISFMPLPVSHSTNLFCDLMCACDSIQRTKDQEGVLMVLRQCSVMFKYLVL